MIQAVNPSTVPASPFYSQGTEVRGAERMLFVSGQVGVDAEGAVKEGVEEQSRQAVANLGAVLAEAGMGVEDLVKVTIYLTDPADVGPFMAATGGTLPSPPPATTLLLVHQLASPELRVEIEGVAAR
ncbi:RidA family protein [Nocardioides caldifontis]|uniref:RidA family protein n=1 Tax=Nocardioides caldifontis TaxID=2588938 RepID=UPI0011E04AE6|nr:RidA family protein [Nocardioides caldifontis]